MSKPGRPPFQPTDEQRRMVDQMTAYGIPQPDIARCLNIHEQTLRLHFREELDTGAARANANVAEFLYQRATGQHGNADGAVTAAIFWMKTRGRWKEISATELTGKDGAPIEMSVEENRQKRCERAAQLIEAVFREVSNDEALKMPALAK